MTAPIGRLKSLWRYPVKSMRGEDLAKAWVSFSGIMGDRVYAFVNPEKKNNFPWLTAREVPEMILFTGEFEHPPEEDVRYPTAESYRTSIITPEGDRHAIEDPRLLDLLKERWKRPIQLRFSEQGMQDSRPISVFGLPTLAWLKEHSGAPIDALRFRANFYVEWAVGEPFYEETLIGKALQIGPQAQIVFVKKDSRCVIINLDPATAAPERRVLETIAKERGGHIGMYAAVLKEGLVSQGDLITLSEL